MRNRSLGRGMGYINSRPKAGPDSGPTGPSEPDEMELLTAKYGEPDENGVFVATNQDDYAEEGDDRG